MADVLDDSAHIEEEQEEFTRVTQRTKKPRSKIQSTFEHSDLQDSFTTQDLNKLFTELRAMRTEMSNFTKAVMELKTTMAVHIERIDSFDLRLQKIEDKVNEPNRPNQGDLEATICRLELELRDRDQDALINDIEISGIPEVKNEGTFHIIKSVATKLGIDLDERDIVSAERVGAVRAHVEGQAVPRPRNIAVRLVRRAKRDEILREARVRRGCTTSNMDIPGEAKRFYVNEHLTKFNSQLFYKAREFAKNKNWRYVWTRNGTMYARYEHGSERRIRTPT
ncbi:jg9016 [Pararge aegeria aegeria]|uniref:Jg9016 protein n=1 Tax=Pararge aegeria aegeria TaxID=348720 RepID=A0A8S4QZV0_9NEOP|nr:jg9016 [Pararge aegeria aegeria]